MIETDQYGFNWGSAKIKRYCELKNGIVVLGIETPKYPDGIQIQITKSGKVRVYYKQEEWKPLGKCDGGCCDNGTGYCMFCERKLC